ncbi:MAG: type II toxin-antitoxin system VapC family toxin [Nanoarchaeota archaeon]
MLIFDTSAIIEIERENKYLIDKIEKLKENEKGLPKISFITYFEFIEGIDKKIEKNKEKARNFIKLFEVIQTTNITAEKLVYLRRNYELPLPDLLIASQVMENNGTLITKDKDFEQIKEINKIILS